MCSVTGCGGRRVRVSITMLEALVSRRSLKATIQRAPRDERGHCTGVLYASQIAIPACARVSAPPASICIAHVTGRVLVPQACPRPSPWSQSTSTWSTAMPLDSMVSSFSRRAIWYLQLFCPLCRAETVTDRARSRVAYTGAGRALSGHLYVSVCSV